MIASINKKTLKECISTKAGVILLLVAIVFLGAFLRLYKLGNNDVWFDEAISALSAENVKGVYSLSDEKVPYGNLALEKWQPQLIHYKTLDPQPFFYYFLLKHTIDFLGSNAFSMRLLSVFFSILTILVTYKLGTLLSCSKNGMYAAFLVSISPLYIWYAQEARQYSLAVFLITLSAYFLFQALEKGDNRPWIGFIIASVLLIYTNYIGLLFLAVGWPLLCIKKYRKLAKKMVIAHIIIVAFFVPWVRIFWQHLLFVKEAFWITRPSFFSIMITIKNFNIGYNSFQSFFTLSWILFFGLALRGVFHLRQKARLFLLTSMCLPILLIFIISQQIPIYLDRQLILFSPFYYIIIAAGIADIKSNVARWAVICLILVFVVPSIGNYFSNYMPAESYIYHQGAYTKKPFQPAINYIEDNWQKGDAIVYSHVSVKPSFIYYQKYGGLKQNDQNKFNYKRMWLISSSWSRDCELSQKVQLLRERLDERYKKADTAEFDGIFIDLYITGHSS